MAEGQLIGNAGNTTIEVKGVQEVQETLAKLMTTNPKMKSDLKKIMRSVITQARKKLMQTAQTEVGTGYKNSAGDQRKAYRAIKTAVYKKIFGGNVNIISRRKRSGRTADVPGQKRQSGRGGNRRSRSATTERMMSYWGEDRGFILRWLNSGTSLRHINVSEKAERYGNRGHIAGNGWFGNSSMQAMSQASEELSTLIERAIDEVWGDGASKKA